MVFAIANSVVTTALDHVLALGARWLTLAKISINVVLKASGRQVVAADGLRFEHRQSPLLRSWDSI